MDPSAGIVFYVEPAFLLCCKPLCSLSTAVGHAGNNQMNEAFISNNGINVKKF